MTLTTADTSSSIEREMERLFPLPLTMMEAFMLADATPDYPMMCDVEMQFTGRIERRAFDEAVAVAMRRAPIFRSVVERDAKGRPQWSLTDRTPLVDWRPWGAPFGEEYDTLIDIERELPMRLYVREGAERSTVVMHLHHSGADGLGCFAFAEDFLAAYANASSPAPVVELRPFDPARLLTRGVASIAPSKGWQVVVDGWIGLREAIRFFWQRPQPLAPRSSVGANDASQLRPCAQRQQVGYIYQTCPDDVAAGLRSLAAERQVTLNDLLMRDLYLTLAAWIGVSPKQYLRILMPQNLREKADDAMPATNRLGFAFLTRRADWVQRPRDLLASLNQETSAIVQGQLSRFFLDGLGTVHSLGLLPRLLGGSLCFSTAVLTNLGSPQRRFVTKLPKTSDGLQVGNLVLSGITAMPPLRPKTAAAFAITGHRQSFNICLKCDSFAFSRAETENLLALYLEQLAATARGETDA